MLVKIQFITVINVVMDTLEKVNMINIQNVLKHVLIILTKITILKHVLNVAV